MTVCAGFSAIPRLVGLDGDEERSLSRRSKTEAQGSRREDSRPIIIKGVERMNPYRKEILYTLGFFVLYLLAAHTAPWVMLLGTDNSVRILGRVDGLG